MNNLRLLALWLALPGLALLLLGCASSQRQSRSTAVTMQDGVRNVEVLLDEYRIHMPTTLPPGPTKFQVKNIGGHTHTISIRRGDERVDLEHLKPRESAELEMNLVPGKYHVWCPIGPHSTLGMRLDLTVKEQGP